MSFNHVTAPFTQPDWQRTVCSLFFDFFIRWFPTLFHFLWNKLQQWSHCLYHKLDEHSCSVEQRGRDKTNELDVCLILFCWPLLYLHQHTSRTTVQMNTWKATSVYCFSDQSLSIFEVLLMLHNTNKIRFLFLFHDYLVSCVTRVISIYNYWRRKLPIEIGSSRTMNPHKEAELAMMMTPETSRHYSTKCTRQWIQAKNHDIQWWH